jgi:hypothetical protein
MVFLVLDPGTALIVALWANAGVLSRQAGIGGVTAPHILVTRPHFSRGVHSC